MLFVEIGTFPLDNMKEFFEEGAVDGPDPSPDLLLRKRWRPRTSGDYGRS